LSFKRIAAVALIFVCTSVAWLFLAGSISVRTDESNLKLKPDVASTWGSTQQQVQPTATYLNTQKLAKEANIDGKKVVTQEETASTESTPAEKSRVKVGLAVDYRQKGLLWYSLYTVDFSGTYTFRNPTAEKRTFWFHLKFPAEHAIYDDFVMEIDGRPAAFTATMSEAYTAAELAPNQAVQFRAAYRSHGMEEWRYKLGEDVTQTRDFELRMATNFKDIDFPNNTLSPNSRSESPRGWDLVWDYKDLISGYAVAMTMPGKLQPGPLAGDISRFAPVSLLLFFFVMLIITTIRNIELHPMNYFFLAAAFFAFHLLFAYLVDRVPVSLAFAIASVVSVALVVSYLRLVVGVRFALVEAGAAQSIYLVLFSFTFFLKGFTGLAVTIGCILTLFVAMQVTGRIKWADVFAGAAVTPARPLAEPMQRGESPSV